MCSAAIVTLLVLFWLILSWNICKGNIQAEEWGVGAGQTLELSIAEPLSRARWGSSPLGCSHRLFVTLTENLGPFKQSQKNSYCTK